MSSYQTSSEHIYYYSQESQEILDLSLEYSFEEIGFYLTFKAAYFFYKGQIPENKLFKFCRVFENQEKFLKFIEENFEKKEGFFYSKNFENSIKIIQEKSKKRKASIAKRWSNNHCNTDSNVDTKVNTIVSTNEDTNGIQYIDINNDININNKKGVKGEKEKIPEIPDFLNAELWNNFLLVRKSLKAKSTDFSIKLLIKDLNRFEDEKIGNANLALENSIKNNWKGVFSPSNNSKTSKSAGVLW